MYDKKLKKGYENLSYHKYSIDESRFTNSPNQSINPYENFGRKRYQDDRKKPAYNYVDYDDVANMRKKIISYDDI